MRPNRVATRDGQRLAAERDTVDPHADTGGFDAPAGGSSRAP